MDRESALCYYMDVTRSGIFTVQYATVLSAMTIDRVAFVLLNLKYQTSWVSRKIPKWLFAFCCIVSCAVTLILFFTIKTKDDFLRAKEIYIWPITDSVVVVVFMVSYSLITHQVRQKSKKLLQSQHPKIYRKRVQQVTRVPLLIVSTFIVFWFSTDIVKMLYMLHGKALPLAFNIVIILLVSISYSLDAIFYIYFLQPIRKVVYLKLATFNRRRLELVKHCAKNDGNEDVISPTNKTTVPPIAKMFAPATIYHKNVELPKY